MKTLNPQDPDSAAAFVSLIRLAAAVWCNRLMLGGMYQSTEHCEEIHDAMHSLYHLLDDYEELDRESLKQLL